MKLEIEVTEDDIRSAIERKIRVSLAQTVEWSDSYIREQLKAQWKACVDKLVVEELMNSEKLKKKIATAIESKLKAQLTAAMKVSK